MEKELAIKMHIEMDPLYDKIVKLIAFINSPDFKTIKPIQQVLLQEQKKAMIRYYNILGLRLRNFTDDVIQPQELEVLGILDDVDLL